MKKLPLIVTNIFFLGYAAFIALTFQDYGITWDEEVQNHYGKLILKYYASFFQDKSFLDYYNLYLYGGLFDSLAALLNKISPWGEYETRHLLNAFAGYLGVCGVYFLVCTLTQSPWFALLGAVFLILSPRYYGHSFNNPKDIPFAVFYVLSLLAMTLSLRHWDKKQPSLKAALGLGLAIGGALGTRIGGLILICYLLGLHSAYWSFHKVRNLPLPRTWCKAFREDVLCPAAVAFAIMLIFWPYAQLDPVSNTWKAFQEINHFQWAYPVLFEGHEILATEVPWNYIPKWHLIATPLTHIFGLALFILQGCIPGFWKLAKGETMESFIQNRMSLGLLVFAILFPVAWVIKSGSTLYDGLRHFLFLMPLICICAALGYCYAYDSLRKALNVYGRKLSIFKIGYFLAIFISLLPVIHWTVRSHPNQYIYFNEIIGGLRGAFTKFETDYYGNTERQAAIWLNQYIKGHPLERKVLVCTYSNPMQIKYYLDTNRFLYNPTKWNVKSCDLFIANLRWNVRPDGTLLHAIQVDGVPLVYIVLNDERMEINPNP